MEIASLYDLRDYFIRDTGFEFPEEIWIYGVKFLRKRNVGEITMDQILIENKKPVIVYVAPTTKPSKLKEKNLNQVIVFVWRKFGNTRVFPYDVRFSSLPRLKAVGYVLKENSDTISMHKNQLIGTTVDVAIINMPSENTIKAKVDTGADICSLHAENIKVNNGEVSFVNKDISPNIISAPIVDKQLIKTSNGDTEYRPVISLNIKINGFPLKDVLFNLNDRTTMEYPMLIGKNALAAGKFRIDASIDEDIDEDEILVLTEEQIMDLELDFDKIQELCEEDNEDFDPPVYIELSELKEFIKNKEK